MRVNHTLIVVTLLVAVIFGCSQATSTSRSPGGQDSDVTSTNGDEQIATNPVQVTGRNLLNTAAYIGIRCVAFGKDKKCAGFNAAGNGEGVTPGTKINWNIAISGAVIPIPAKNWLNGGASTLVPRSLLGTATQGKISLNLSDSKAVQEHSVDSGTFESLAGGPSPGSPRVTYLFVTRATHSAKLGGVAGAAGICRTAVDSAGWGNEIQKCAPMLGAHWPNGYMDSRAPIKAAFPDLMPGGGSSTYTVAQDVFHRQADGSKISYFAISDSLGRTLGEESLPPRVDEHGIALPLGEPLWIGRSQFSGTMNSDDCGDLDGNSWQDNNDIDYGGISKIQRIPYNWSITSESRKCALEAHLICVCQ